MDAHKCMIHLYGCTVEYMNKLFSWGCDSKKTFTVLPQFLSSKLPCSGHTHTTCQVPLPKGQEKQNSSDAEH